MAITYKDAGVDIDASNAAKKRIRELARETFTPAFFPTSALSAECLRATSPA